jgi:hypothetical protein
MSRKFSPLSLGLLLIAVLLGIWLKAPLVGAGIPYFYHEDEAHHHNRVVNMVKEGRYDPQYFHKPSLHFYLRMPVVATAFVWGVKRGHLRELEEIKTADSYGLSGYAFRLSHPGVVKWNRAFSLFLSLVLVGLTFYLALALGASNGAAFLSAALVAVSPEVVKNSAIIGVDTLMATMVTATLLAAVQALRSLSLGSVILVGVLSGLAVSSKYNAAPVALLPLASCLFSRAFTPPMILAALISPLLGFLLGSPFILANLPLFLNQLAYEIWHYGLQGHAGHMAQPGLEQFLFYTSWLFSDGIGLVASILAGIGVVVMFKLNDKKQSLLFILFPLLFMVLMISQKTNFTRNVLPVVPFFALFAALAVQYLISRFNLGRGRKVWLWSLASALLLMQPAARSFSYVQSEVLRPESRLEASKWLIEHEAPDREVAVSGHLQMPYSLLGRPGYSEYDPSRQTFDDLLRAGFSQIVTGNQNLPEDALEVYPLSNVFYGSKERQRVVNNPLIRIYEIKEDLALQRLKDLGAESIFFDCETLLVSGVCSVVDASQDYTWFSARHVSISFINLPKGLPAELTLQLELMTPWREQVFAWQIGQSSGELDFSSVSPGQWQTARLEIDARTLYTKPLMLYLAKVHSPRALGVGRDPRRLGVAIKSITIAERPRPVAKK